MNSSPVCTKEDAARHFVHYFGHFIKFFVQVKDVRVIRSIFVYN